MSETPGLLSAAWGTVLQAVLPAIALLSGILSLYVDPQKDPRKKWLLVTVMVLSAVATIGVGMHDEKLHDQAAAALNGNIDAQNKELALQQTQLDSVSTSSADTNVDVKALINFLQARFGIKDMRARYSQAISLAQIKVSIEADQKMNLLAPQLPAASIKPCVIYYAKDVDSDVVMSALQKAQLNVQIKQPIDKNATDVIWIGDRIQSSVAQFVALTLVRAGVKLTSILRFHDGSGAKANLIEVGAYEDFRNNPVLSIDDIVNMNQFSRDPKSAAPYVVKACGGTS